MYYVRDHRGKKIWIEDNNVFTQCPRCGKEIPVDLNDGIVDGQLDLYGTSWYCSGCSEKMRKSVNIKKSRPKAQLSPAEKREYL